MTKTVKKRHSEPAARISTHQMQSLAFNYGTLIEAQNSLPENSGVDLAELVQQDDKLAEAWQRGQFLRNVRNLASVPVSMDEASKRLSLNGAEELQGILETDAEAGDTWRQTRQEAFIQIKLALVKTAREGNQAAIRAVENFLRAEMDYKAGGGPRRLRVAEIANLTGRSRHGVYDWVEKNNLPLGPDKTIELKDFIRWFETFTAENAAGKNEGRKEDSRLHAVKAETIEMELKRRRRQLLPREEFIAGILARHQLLVNSVRQKAPQIAQLCQGQKPERVAEIIIDSLGDICRELCQVPAELCLPESAAKGLKDVLEILNNEFTKNGD